MSIEHFDEVRTSKSGTLDIHAVSAVISRITALSKEINHREGSDELDATLLRWLEMTDKYIKENASEVLT